MSDLFTSLMKEAGNEFAGIVDDGVEAGDVSGFVSTGSYTLNALLSGSIYGGIPANKVTALAGEPATGKTFYAINICKQFLEDNPEGFIFYFESESAVTRQMFVDRGVDPRRVMMMPVETVEGFRTQAMKILQKYLATKEKDRKPMMFVLDSLGMLSTVKEMEDIAKGENKRDMTRAQVIKGAFRALTLKLGKAKVALLVTNHVYDVVGAYVPIKKMGGGCLAHGTKIRTENGLEEIQNIRTGDKVETLFGLNEVSETFHFPDKETFSITFDDGTTIECSGDHKFLVEGKWMSVSDMVDVVKNTKSINIDVADIYGDEDVYRQQIYENLLLTDGESEAA